MTNFTTLSSRAVVTLIAILTSAIAGATTLATETDPVLIENSSVQIRKSDYERELMRLPAEVRSGFATNARRVNDLLRRMLVTRTLAEQARESKLDQDPETIARIASEVERYLAQLKLQQIDSASQAGFDANIRAYEARAREVYLVDRQKYALPEQIRASHILFDLKRHTREEGERLARDWRAKIVAGDDFNKVAKEVSEDPSAATNAGRLDWFSRAEMDPAFADVAFKLGSIGEISQPVLSQFGWHLVRLEERRPAGVQKFEEVREQIMDDLKRKYANDQRDAHLAKLNADSMTRVNAEAIASLVVRGPDREAVRRALDGMKGKDAAPPTIPSVTR